jgi:epsilon-lactone hydrolase
MPGISPVYGDMPGLPPVVMRSAGDDPLSIDADKIETAVAATGTGVVDNHRFDNLWRVFHLQAGVLAEADEAITDLGARLRTHPTERKVATK